MPKKTKSNESVEVVETPVIEQSTNVSQLTKEDYLRARATIKQYREEKKNKPKRHCSDAQLAALAKGRAMNKRLANKTIGTKQ